MVYTLKKTRVYVQNVAVSTGTAYMLKHMCAWCRYTRGRFEWTHGGQGVITSSAYQNLPT